MMQYSFQELLPKFIDGDINVNQKDYAFFNNIFLRLKNNEPITTNQTMLFRKLLRKTKQQFEDMGIDLDVEKVIWDQGAKLVESSSDFTVPQVWTDDSFIYIRTPWNRKWMDYIKNMGIYWNLFNPFEYSKTDRAYKADIKNILSALKIIDPFIFTIWKEVNFDEKTNSIRQEIDSVKGLIKKPTLVKVNDRLYIAAATQPLMDKLDEIPISRVSDGELVADPSTIMDLVSMGVSIDSSISSISPALEFASSNRHRIPESKLAHVFKLLPDLNIKNCHISFRSSMTEHEKLSKNIKLLASESSIHVSSNVAWPVLTAQGIATNELCFDSVCIFVRPNLSEHTTDWFRNDWAKRLSKVKNKIYISVLLGT